MRRGVISGATLMLVGVLLAGALSAWVVEGVYSQPHSLGEVVASIPLPQVNGGFTAYDPADGEVYVATAQPLIRGTGASENVTVLDAANDRIVANVTMTEGPEGEPEGIAVDPLGDRIYVVNFDGNVTEIAGDTNTRAGSFRLPFSLLAASWDPVQRFLLVTTWGGTYLDPHYNLSAVNATTGAIVWSAPVGVDPTALAFDALTDEVWVSNDATPEVTVVNASTAKVSANVQLPGNPSGLAFDSTEDEVDVAVAPHTGYGVNLTAIGGTSHAVIGTIVIPGRTLWADVVFDGADSDAYVTCQAGEADTSAPGICVVDGATLAMRGFISGVEYDAFGDQLQGLTWDSSNGELFTSEFDSLTEVTTSAPVPSDLSVVESLPNVDWAFFGMFLGAVVVLLGAGRLWQARRPPSSAGRASLRDGSGRRGGTRRAGPKGQRRPHALGRHDATPLSAHDGTKVPGRRAVVGAGPPTDPPHVEGQGVPREDVAKRHVRTDGMEDLGDRVVEDNEIQIKALFSEHGLDAVGDVVGPSVVVVGGVGRRRAVGTESAQS